jgi:hypothetical protein
MDDRMLEKIARRLLGLQKSGLSVGDDELSVAELGGIIDEEFGAGTAATYEAAMRKRMKRTN